MMKTYTHNRLSLFAKILLILFFVVGVGCQNNSTNSTPLVNTTDSIIIDEDALQSAAQTIISIPSPIETTYLFRMAGVNYQEEVLNPVSNVALYNTNNFKAFNLGVYSADLSYLSHFDQAQQLIDYVNASKTLADAIGVLDAVDQKTIKSLEDNMGNPDVLMSIISETLMESDSYLKENSRAQIAAIIVTGGWIESLYIATKLSNKSLTDNKHLVNIIIDHRLHILDLVQLLETFKYDKDIAELLVQIKELQTKFEKVEVKKIPADNGNALSTKTETTISEDAFVAICDKVELIRQNYTNI